MPLSFQHVATELRLFCGDGCLASLERELAREGCSRAVVVSGRTLHDSHAMELLRNVLGPALIGECVTVRPNSPLPAVTETAQILDDLKADCVIAVGGGSAAVTARAAGILLAENAPAQTLSTRRLPDGTFESPRLRAPKLPQFIIPTTPSTAFVKAGSAVHDVDTGRRLALFDPKTRVKALFVHPEFLRTAPDQLIKTASLNTLSTAVEAITSPKCDPIAEAMLTHSLRLIANNLNSSDLEDIPQRERLVLAAVLCGRGTEHSGGGLASVLAHAIGAYSEVANGVVNAIVLPHAMRFNAPEVGERFDAISEALLGDSGSRPYLENSMAAVDAIEALFGRLLVPRRLQEIGITRDDLPKIAKTAMSDWFITRNSRRVSSQESVLSILEECW